MLCLDSLLVQPCLAGRVYAWHPGVVEQAHLMSTRRRTGRPADGGAVRARTSRAALGVAVVLAALMVGAGTAPAARVVRPVTLPPVRVVVWPDRLGAISPYLFGANLLWPYNAEGAFDVSTDEFRASFVEEVRSMGVTALRYPAGRGDGQRRIK